MTTETPGVSAPAETTGAAHPSELLSGKPLPMKEHTFTRSDGKKVTIKMQGLTYAQKSELDGLRRIDRAEEDRTGEAKPDLHGPRLIARAARLPDGTRAFQRDEDEVVFAISLGEQMSDGEINRGADQVLILSGWGKDAEAQAVKP